MRMIVLVCVAALALSCGRQEAAEVRLDPAVERGRDLVVQRGCGVCHTIPNIPDATGAIGPSLAGVASRPALSNGTVRNTPENMARFIQNPPSINPQSRMPPLGLTAEEARDLAAFLRTLR